jgi:hypothetical protein
VPGGGAPKLAPAMSITIAATHNLRTRWRICRDLKIDALGLPR